MKEIKFRAYDKTYKVMLYNVEKTYDYGCRGDNKIQEYSFADVLNNEQYDVMQYTGLKDKNGKEIYEGDIVSEKSLYSRVNKKIQWKQSYSCWLRGEWQRLTPKNVKEYDIEVIGNIYDNPDLIKE